MEYGPIIDKKRSRLEELESFMSNPNFFDDAKKAGELMREHRSLQKLVKDWDAYSKTRTELAENREMAKGNDELAEMAAAEIPVLEKQEAALETSIQMSILPPDPLEGRDVIMEIRAGTGGDEAAIFAGDLYRMYNRYAENRGWKVEPMEGSTSDAGGYKEVVFKVSGEDVYRTMRFESGVHRVQRVPATEAQGRIHTSAATVAVLPEAQEIDLELNMNEIRIEVSRSSGAGGQGVNTTDSAVQVMHMPTGMIVRCQDGRSQIKNKEKALTILRSRMLEKKQQEEASKYSAHRKALIGGGGREEKIRTYNYPQNRVTDHRIEVNLYNLDSFVEGNIDGIVEKLVFSDLHERLLEAGLG